MNHITDNIKALFMVPLAALSFASCSDSWDEHFSPESQTGNKSIWNYIENNAELSNFASVVKHTGYDRALGGSRTFSVFAPVNSAFTQEEAEAIIAKYDAQKAAGTQNNDNSAIKEFLQNYITYYGHSVSSVTNDSLLMMNGKYQLLTPSTFAGNNLLTSNIACTNGMVYTVDGQANYFPNVYEYIDKDSEIDSVAKFINSFNSYYFDASKSVPGEIINGKTHYLDSVITRRNSLLEGYLAPIDSEDSAYWAVVPTNDVWNKLVPQYEQYFQYDKSVGDKRDSLTWVQARLAMIRGTIFNRRTNTDAMLQDSAMSVNAVSYNMRKYMWGDSNMKYYQYDKPFAEGGVFNGTENIECSNGKVLKASKWNITPEQTFLRTVNAEGESSSRLDSVDQSTTVYPATTYRVATSNPYYGKLSNNGYVEIAALSRSNTTSYFSIPNLLSNVGYDIYVVTAPALAGDEYASDAQRLPTKFKVWLRYQNESGTVAALQRDWIALDGDQNKTAATWETRADEVDTFKVATNVKIPYTTYALGVGSKVELVFKTSPTNSQVNNGIFNRILRIDQILVVPHDDEDTQN